MYCSRYPGLCLKRAFSAKVGSNARHSGSRGSDCSRNVVVREVLTGKLVIRNRGTTKNGCRANCHRCRKLQLAAPRYRARIRIGENSNIQIDSRKQLHQLQETLFDSHASTGWFVAQTAKAVSTYLGNDISLPSRLGLQHE